MITVLLGTGFEETEAVAPVDLLRRAGAEVRLAGIGGRRIVSSHGITVETEDTVETVDFDRMELLMLPGGLRGVQSIRDCPAALDLIRRAWAEGRYLAAICAAPTILGDLGLLDGKRATCYPDMLEKLPEASRCPDSVVTDGRLITGRAAGSSLDFGLALVRTLFGEETARRVAHSIRYEA